MITPFKSLSRCAAEPLRRREAGRAVPRRTRWRVFATTTVPRPRDRWKRLTVSWTQGPCVADRGLVATSRIDNAPSSRGVRCACGEHRLPTDTNPSPASDGQARALLERYKCPVPFHEVRTRLLGNIASPVMSASPIKVVQDLWGGELPPFDTIEEANELIGALVMGLWNRLTRHQDRASPFRLMRVDTASTREGLAALALMRRQELDGFIEGLFGRRRGGRSAEACASRPRRTRTDAGAV